MIRHLTSLCDLTTDDLKTILSTAAELKEGFRKGDRPKLLQGHVLTLLFEKPSLRTRNSFEAGMIQLGGGAIFQSLHDAGLNGRESFEDIARVASSYSDAIVMRTFSQQLIESFAEQSSCSVINGLSDDRHPCQALTDVFTMQELFGDVAGKRLVFVGDGNNVAVSLAIVSAMLGISFSIASPEPYQLSASFLNQLSQQYPDTDIVQFTDPFEAVGQADVVYTDVWASMGQEQEVEVRKKMFSSYQVNKELMNAAPKDCYFMHDLPARRGLEVTDDVMESSQSVVFEQAENRMHLAKGLLVWLQNQNSGIYPNDS